MTKQTVNTPNVKTAGQQPAHTFNGRPASISRKRYRTKRANAPKQCHHQAKRSPRQTPPQRQKAAKRSAGASVNEITVHFSPQAAPGVSGRNAAPSLGLRSNSRFPSRHAASKRLFFGRPLVLEYRSGLIDKSNKHKNRQSAVEMPKNTGLLFLAGCQGFGGPERCNCRLRSSVAQTNAALQP